MNVADFLESRCNEVGMNAMMMNNEIYAYSRFCLFVSNSSVKTINIIVRLDIGYVVSSTLLLSHAGMVCYCIRRTQSHNLQPGAIWLGHENVLRLVQ